MKFGHPVLYIESGQQYEAIVIRAREIDDHVGAQEEPLLDLAFFKQVLDPAKSTPKKPVYRDVFGTQAQSELVQFRTDVAHESHEFSEEAQKKFGKIYPGGRWKEREMSTFTGRVTAAKSEKK